MTASNKDILAWPSGRLDFSRGCVVMGILNVTPDSFSDSGDFFDVEKAAEQAAVMAGCGAAVIDVGAESTRPGAERITAAEQIKRAVPVIEKITGYVDIPISIDTRDCEVAAAALDAGAAMINDITALDDERMAKLAAERDVPVVLMHMRGTPETMQTEPRYDDVAGQVLNYLLERAERAEKRGIKKKMIFIDPGIGFGKTTEHNLELLRKICVFTETGYRVLVGTSRKRFIGQITGRNEPKERIFGTAATIAAAAMAGASIVRVHDVAEMADVVKIANRLRPERRAAELAG